MQIHPLGVLWRRLTFILFIYLFTFLLIHLFIYFFFNSVIIFVVIEIFLLHPSRLGVSVPRTLGCFGSN